ncbi:hypothetical protein [Leptolyngbya sp. FACHB-16]|uniref:hypothetical protein n=1 Tax=unclassified Leptolyngbya TaxID=2650499 RepID=UPI001688D05B|nr:hypothetical protein [Leptolyngbya sp. FACHB-16]MBD1910738.1 hypothetical protein [Leptolyngbya sp. FACHB-8]MBD2158243.1 hypothetical protein [Leptolyngbya sp. FACHB-16]
MSLQESWNITRCHLKRARHLLPQPLREDSEGGSLTAFEEFLLHNELGLAFDELEMIGMGNHCPPAFWRAMLAAAESMQLFDQAERCRAELL